MPKQVTFARFPTHFNGLDVLRQLKQPVRRRTNLNQDYRDLKRILQDFSASVRRVGKSWKILLYSFKSWFGLFGSRTLPHIGNWL